MAHPVFCPQQVNKDILMPYDDLLPFKVVRTNGHDEVVARAASAAPPMSRQKVAMRMTVSIPAMARIIVRSDQSPLNSE